MLERFLKYAAAFEEAYETRDFTVLVPYFTEDCVYEIHRPGYPEMVLRGRDDVFRFLEWITDAFDRRFAERRLVPMSPPRVTEAQLEIHGAAIYTLEDGARVHWTMTETLVFEGDRIAKLIDHASPGAVHELEWIVEKHPERFPASVISGPTSAELAAGASPA